jgi:hypothetical protein
MKLRPLVLCFSVAALISPLAALAADATTPPAASAKAKKPTCETSTASRIQASPAQNCRQNSSSPTRTYTQEDLQRTGEINTVEALRKLDPRFQ